MSGRKSQLAKKKKKKKEKRKASRTPNARKCADAETENEALAGAIRGQAERRKPD